MSSQQDCILLALHFARTAFRSHCERPTGRYIQCSPNQVLTHAARAARAKGPGQGNIQCAGRRDATYSVRARASCLTLPDPRLPDAVWPTTAKRQPRARSCCPTAMIIEWAATPGKPSWEGARGVQASEAPCPNLPNVVWPAAAKRQPRARSCRPTAAERENGPQRQANPNVQPRAHARLTGLTRVMVEFGTSSARLSGDIG